MKIQFYGAPWCSHCRRSKAYLDKHAIPYEYINIEQDPSAAEKVVELTKGYRSIPTIVMPNGTVLIEPTNAVLEQAVSDSNLDVSEQAQTAHA